LITTHTPESLRAFTASIAKAFNDGTIPGPVHLSGGNEQQLIDIFADVRDEDWCFSTYRSHLHCLLKGVPEDELRAEIMAGRSITLQFPKQKIMTSAIVAGHLPIAVGVALQIKRENRPERVWAFCGDMCAGTGLAHECMKYVAGFGLPLRFVIENNGVSVCSPTDETWQDGRFGQHAFMYPNEVAQTYDYTLPFPHAGAAKRVSF
jgi:TPP-dependent pyruvate/acetoin dehydrogenase alpha subunit